MWTDVVTAGMNFENTYAWCCRFDQGGKVVQVRAYLDSWMVKQAIEENEVPSKSGEIFAGSLTHADNFIPGHRAPVPEM